MRDSCLYILQMKNPRTSSIITTVLIILFPTFAAAQQDARRCIAFWNVENFFDIHHDTLKNDYEFTPEGTYHWSYNRYLDKRNKIFKMLATLDYPAIMGLAEVENSTVLQDLCLGTPLRQKGYRYIHYESPDKRGIDCALLYREDCFKLLETQAINVSNSEKNFFTRDILLVVGVLGEGDTCCLLVNHWPSKSGGSKTRRRRMAVAQLLRHTMDSLALAHPNALVLAMGDFNASPDEEAIRKGMGFGRTGRNDEGFTNLMITIPKGEGTYKYQGSWSCIDQILSNRFLTPIIIQPEYMLLPDTRYLGVKPFRTYLGLRYQGGYSDHLPIAIYLP